MDLNEPVKSFRGQDALDNAEAICEILAACEAIKPEPYLAFPFISQALYHAAMVFLEGEILCKSALMSSDRGCSTEPIPDFEHTGQPRLRQAAINPECLYPAWSILAGLQADCLGIGAADIGPITRLVCARSFESGGAQGHRCRLASDAL
jgi:hypothetical protein